MMDSLVSATELAGRLGEPGLVILDCSVAVARRGGEARAVAMDEAFAEGHIAGALYVDVARALSDPASPLRFTRPRSEALGQVLAGLGIGSDSEVVLYSKERYWTATRAFWVLANAGHKRVRLLDGGWRHWTALGLPVETGAARLPEAVPVERWGDAGLFCDMDAVRTALETSDTLLVNALPPAQFSGAESNYARPGTIPGSVNIPAGALIDPQTGLFHSVSRLREIVTEAGVAFDRPVITFCGAGVAATAAAYVLRRLGHEHVRVYDASLQEWAADPACPLVVL